MIVLKSVAEIAKMRTACRIVAEVLEILKENVQPGVTTLDLEQIALEETKKRGAKPAFKGYSGFPFALCCSPNEAVIHGMPNSVPLESGDILSIDFGVVCDGFYGDSAVTLPVDTITQEVHRLIRTTEESLYCGINNAVVTNRLFDISFAIQNHVESAGYNVVRDFVGHGIGRNLHEDPKIPNYGKSGKGIKLKAGMVFAIEPMVNAGSHEVRVLEDGWTAVTSDGSLSAHFEHTVAITPNGPEVLTKI